ncbi:MAG: bifunctional glutamate N-acetyltransferase/amino-acid acetyltransferase ArgJ [Candidatus Omnitrophica bacterium]|nr:bifunctional glutamate N-acetyltransferase/amino-acid acetyltransferase ArgJ [Candidatus Omnitrophota bacterium]
MRVRSIDGGVTAAAGFVAAGVSAGIKRSRKPDLALVVSEELASAAGVLTRNRVQAAPVVISAKRLALGRARGVLLNSGCANCMTGAAGLRDARQLGGGAARALGIPEEQILLASTGLIGRRLPVARMARAVPTLVQQLGAAHHRQAAQAILTTDLVPKEAAVEAAIGGRRCRVGGMAKGAGMIAPCMATMLCVITTDVGIAAGLLKRLLQRATALTFNRISVDGDMSTNDCVFALANARSGVTIRRPAEAEAFFRMLLAVCDELAQRIVQDGEGASRIMEIRVAGARSDAEAQACARQIANSPLVKTMLAGGDPNVGRIAAAAGASAARFRAERLDIFIDQRRVVAEGVARRVGTAALRRLLSRPKVDVRLELHAGSGSGRMLACDLTQAYVRINAGYAT